MTPSRAPISSTIAAVRDHARAFAEFTYVYPVISRRSGGLSLGVNLNPDKRCNFDCIYCEVDRRTPGRYGRVDPEQIGLELRALVQAALAGELAETPKFRDVGPLTRIIRDIAFSGDGEPTMVPNFADCVEAVVAVRREAQLHDTKLVLITDAAGLDKSDVRRGLALLDANHGEIWGKLDAGTEPYFRLVNRTFVRLERILRNLLLTAQVRPIVIQSLFLRVHGQRMPEEELAAYCDRLNELKTGGAQIREVHAYTVARPTPEAYATRLEPDELDAIAEAIRLRTSLPVMTFV